MQWRDHTTLPPRGLGLRPIAKSKLAALDAAGASGHDAAGSPNSVTKSPPALPQLVAIDDCALSARHVVEDAALDKHVYARVAEQDQRCTIIIAALIARDLPSLREQLVNRQRCLRCRQAGRRQHHCQEQGLRPRETRDRRQRGSTRGQMQKISAGKFHSALPARFTSL